MIACVYILKSLKNGSFYIGSTIDFESRFNKHQKGYVLSTTHLRPFEVKLVQEYDNITIAKQIEFKLKKLKRKDYIEKIIQDGHIKMKIQ